MFNLFKSKKKENDLVINPGISDNTIMPDGRPLYAWENELKMLRKADTDLEIGRRQLSDNQKILQIAYIETMTDIPTGDIIVRIKRNKMITRNDIMEAYEVIRKQTK